ncbi:MAG: hypothetical protein ACKPBU_15030, partial [Alphaproteobacteria bacterium]
MEDSLRDQLALARGGARRKQVDPLVHGRGRRGVAGRLLADDRRQVGVEREHELLQVELLLRRHVE